MFALKRVRLHGFKSIETLDLELRSLNVLIGANGQRICVDPASKLIMVQTAVEDTDEVWGLWSALVKQFGDE